MRLVTFGVGILICLVIMAVGIYWITQRVTTGGGALGLGLGGLIDVIYLYLRVRNSNIGVDVKEDSITLFYRVSNVDGLDLILTIVVLLACIIVGGIIWH